LGCTGTSPGFNVIENTVQVYNSSIEICAGESVVIHGQSESVAGVYSFTYVLPTGCDSTSNVTLIVNPLPVIDAGLDQVECEGVSVTLNATGTPTITWDIAPVVNGIPFTQNVGTVTYTATGVDANNCSNTDQVDITINPEPAVDPILDDVLCHGASTNAINFTGTLAGTSYAWTNDMPSIGLAANGTGDIPLFAAVNIGATPIIATIAVTPTLNGCTGSTESCTITVNPLPNVFAGIYDVVCEGDQISLTGSGAFTYAWNNNVIDGQPFSPASGTYTVIGTDANGCVNTDDVLITMAPLPIVSFTAVVPPCAPFIATLTNTTPGNMDDCIWTINNGAIINDCGPIVYTFENPGTFDVTLTTTSDAGCTGSATYLDFIYIEESPNAAFTPSSSVVSNLNTEVQFNNTSTNAVDYVWTFGDGSGSITEENPTHTFPDDTFGSYLVTLIAYSSIGCSDTAYATVKVNEEVIFYVPNTFTPDADDHNETFQPVFTSGYDPFDYTLLIFNRWGEIIFESHNVDVGWDATYGGDHINVQDGTYTWKIEFKTTQTDERINVVGHVNVIR